MARHPELKNDREFLRMQVDSYRRAFQRMRQVGKPEAAESFMRAQLAIIQRLDGPPTEPPTTERDDLERRIKHVEVAMNNLRAAGLHSFAESLAREMERMIDEPRLPRPPERFEPPEILGTPFPSQSRQPDASELHQQVERMQREMDELRGLVKKLLEQNRRGARD